MSSDLIGRRRAVEERLDRARALELTLKDATDLLGELAGASIEQLDFDGSFRAALTALAGVASRRTQFDVVITLPESPFGVRIQLLHNEVSADAVALRGGPYEPVKVPASRAPAPSEQRTTDQRTTEQLATEKRALEQRMLELRASDPRTADQGTAEQRASDQRAGRSQPAEVASELAALLWQGVEDVPS